MSSKAYSFNVAISVDNGNATWNITNPDGSPAPEQVLVTHTNTTLTYTLTEVPDGCIFVDPEITEAPGCHDMTFEIAESKQVIVFTDADTDNEEICMVLRVDINGVIYPSPDPQAKNRRPRTP